MNIEMVKLEAIKPYKNNPRKNDNAVDVVAKSIQEFGFKVPIILDMNNEIIAGHTRLKAAQKLKISEVPVIRADDLNEDQVKAFRIMDNKSQDYAEWDNELLKQEFYDLEDTDYFNLTGFTTDEITDIWDNQVKEDDFDTEKSLKEPKYKIKIGDIYELEGNGVKHRLMCGDCTIKENVDKLLNNEKIDLLLTDPPYGINIVKDNNRIGFGDGRLGFKSSNMGTIPPPPIVPVGKHKKILNDDKPFDPEFLLSFGKNQIIWGGNYFATKLRDTPCWVIWDKREEVPSNNFADCEIAWTSFKKPSRIYRQLWSGLLRKGNRNIEMNKRTHPTQKPVGIHIKLLNDYSNEYDNLLDLYGGSGTTLIACEQTKRNCYMMELDNEYCSVILERWENLTGKKAKKIELNEKTNDYPDY